MKRLIVLLLLINTVHLYAQKKYDTRPLQAMEDSLKYYAKQMVFAQDASGRFYADSVFIKNFVKALKTPYSFYYPFDSLKTISKLYAPDSSFRIFTWQIEMDESYFRQFGALQLHSNDGSLKLIPLFDQSDYSSIPTDSVRSFNNWIGAIYFQVVMKEFNHKKYYTLIGFDDNDFVSTKKWIEVLTFDSNMQPVFGGPFFDYKADATKPPQPAARFCLEYKKDAKARIVYDPELDMIIFDHLISESNEDNKKYTLIPDGDYEGFKWVNGKWVHVDKIFETQKLKDGQAPVPAPFLDKDGKPINPQ